MSKKTDRAAQAAAQWQRDFPELDFGPMMLLGRLAQAATLAMRDHIEPVFKQHGLHSGEFDVLATLRRAGAGYALTPTALFKATMVSSGGMTARLDRLEKRGLIARAPNPNDRRGTLVRLTKPGISLIETTMKAHLANETRMLAGMRQADQDQLSALLGTLLKDL